MLQWQWSLFPGPVHKYNWSAISIPSYSHKLITTREQGSGIIIVSCHFVDAKYQMAKIHGYKLQRISMMASWVGPGNEANYSWLLYLPCSRSVTYSRSCQLERITIPTILLLYYERKFTRYWTHLQSHLEPQSPGSCSYPCQFWQSWRLSSDWPFHRLTHMHRSSWCHMWSKRNFVYVWKHIV